MRILIADDSLFWCEQLRAILEQNADWIVFEASNGSEAVQKSSWVHPDVAILDVCMPVLDGLGAARELKHTMPNVSVVMWTVDKSVFLEAAARQIGVLAVFSKMDCLEIRDFLRRRFETHAA